jgi:hypothetical protein
MWRCEPVQTFKKSKSAHVQFVSAVSMVDLGGYVIILVETSDKRVKLYGEFISYLFYSLTWLNDWISSVPKFLNKNVLGKTVAGTVKGTSHHQEKSMKI